LAPHWALAEDAESNQKNAQSRSVRKKNKPMRMGAPHKLKMN
jgi:hypothetical protein